MKEEENIYSVKFILSLQVRIVQNRMTDRGREVRVWILHMYTLPVCSTFGPFAVYENWLQLHSLECNLLSGSGRWCLQVRI